MPPNYKYEFITLRRSKSLKMANTLFYELRKEFAESKIIAPSIIERMRVLQILLQHAHNGMAGDQNDEKVLDELLGPESKISKE